VQFDRNRQGLNDVLDRFVAADRRVARQPADDLGHGSSEAVVAPSFPDPLYADRIGRQRRPLDRNPEGIDAPTRVRGVAGRNAEAQPLFGEVLPKPTHLREGVFQRRDPTLA